MLLGGRSVPALSEAMRYFIGRMLLRNARDLLNGVEAMGVWYTADDFRQMEVDSQNTAMFRDLSQRPPCIKEITERYLDLCTETVLTTMS